MFLASEGPEHRSAHDGAEKWELKQLSGSQREDKKGLCSRKPSPRSLHKPRWQTLHLIRPLSHSGKPLSFTSQHEFHKPTAAFPQSLQSVAQSMKLIEMPILRSDPRPFKSRNSRGKM